MHKKWLDIRTYNKHIVTLKKPVVYLNYCYEDEAYSTPLKDILRREGIDYICKKNLDRDYVYDCDIIISIITGEFAEDNNCRTVLEYGNSKNIRLVSIVFDSDDSVWRCYFLWVEQRI